MMHYRQNASRSTILSISQKITDMFFELFEIVHRFPFALLGFLLEVVEPFNFLVDVPTDSIVVQECVVILVYDDVGVIPRQPPAGQKLLVLGIEQSCDPTRPSQGIG